MVSWLAGVGTWLFSRALGPGTEQLSEDALVQIARRGGAKGRAAFGELVLREQGWLVRMLTALLGNQGDAEDVAQETFTKAYLALARYRGEGRFRAWLRVIGTREAFNARRRIRERLPGVLPEVAHVEVAFEGVLAHAELVDVLSRLPYAWREALVLRHVEGLTPPELAALWDTSVPAAKMRLSRARARFIEVHRERAGGRR